MTKRVDIGNFMGVIQATEQTETGLCFPGAHMPSGNPVTTEGATLAQLMSDRGMAEQWHESIKGAYEREKDEINQSRVEEDTPDLVIRGHDDYAGDGSGSAAPATVHREEPEEELQEAASLEEILEARMDKWAAEIGRLSPLLREAEDEHRKAVRAYEAVTDDGS